MIRITMLGTGYVGLVTGACLAELGNQVTCADIDSRKIRLLMRGELPFYEPGLAELVEKNRAAGRLSFELEPAAAVSHAQVVFISVGTPPLPDGSADLSAVFAARHLVIENNPNRYVLLVQKSTSPVGTARRLREEIASRNGHGAHVDVAVNPEFLREGTAIHDFLHPDRVVIGAETVRAERLLRKLYLPLLLQGTPAVVTNYESAEMIKYASNCFLATKISYINEIADLCETVGADVRVVARGMGLDGRIGHKFLHAGPGFGGSCFPKDTQALVRFAAEKGERLRIAEAALDVNRSQRERMVRKTEEALGGLWGRRIALLGLAFKPDTDDVRESPALDLAELYMARGATVVAHDPAAMATARATPVGQRLTYASGPYAAAKGADALVVVTDWDEYRKLDLKRIAWLLGRPAVFDLRGIYQPQAVAEAGLDYHCVGGSPRLGAAHRAAANGHANGSENGSADLAGEGAPAPVQAARQ
jgi:UDPglucose 6-dehydrogenase